MFELLYTSKATAKFTDSDLVQLLVEAREANQDSGITGILLYRNCEFAQLLEGSESAVKNIYDKIQQDCRHVSVQSLYQGNILERSFANWSMAFKSVDDKDLSLLEGYEEIPVDWTFKHLFEHSENAGKRLLLKMKEGL